MNTNARLALLTLPAALLSAWIGASAVTAANLPTTPKENANGASLTVSSTGGIDTANPFFKAMGNGRSCASCHSENAGWSLTPNDLQQRFTLTSGNDPVFKLVDGANSPRAAVASIDQKRLAYSMLLTKGVIRVGIGMPANAEFSLVRVEDPYGYASAAELSLFRRPLPSANLKFLSTVMWDARETIPNAAGPNCILGANPARCFASIDTDLLRQASDAVRGHAEAAQELSAAEQRAIVNFESGLTAAQVSSRSAGVLTESGGRGGPDALAATTFYWGINDFQNGDYRTRAAFNRNVMNLYGAWRNLATAPAPQPVPGRRPPPPAPASSTDQAKASIARGEALFNTRPINVTNTAGFQQGAQRATCSSCHNAPGAGSHSITRLIDIGVSDARFRTPDTPLYTLRNNATGQQLQTTDPGQAMQTGRWADIGKFKVPTLRNLSARPPYFHNGAQPDLASVVRFYDRRFQMGLNQQEITDLANFLAAL
ncbi:cytochrome C [Pseudoduganella sp. OTU4001]|uniref:cytochrome C n=1 Tax=Pseudoduganella sp. OTU4001 TaxID=3043854 RepID=UPI00313ABFCE